MKRALAILVVALASVVGGCSDADLFGTTTSTTDPSSVPTSPIVTRVAINNFDFTPGELTIVAGTTVEWQNRRQIDEPPVEIDPDQHPQGRQGNRIIWD